MIHLCSLKVTHTKNTMLRGQSIIHVGDVLGLVSFHPRQSRVKPYDERKSSWQRPRVPSRTPWRAPNPAKRSSRNLEEHRRQRCRQQTGGSFLASKPGSILASAEGLRSRGCIQEELDRPAVWPEPANFPVSRWSCCCMQSNRKATVISPSSVA